MCPTRRPQNLASPSIAWCQQVFENCRLYNPAGTNVRSWGDDLSESFERAWATSGVESVWQALQDQRYEQQVRLGGRAATRFAALAASPALQLKQLFQSECWSVLYTGHVTHTQTWACDAHNLRLWIYSWPLQTLGIAALVLRQCSQVGLVVSREIQSSRLGHARTCPYAKLRACNVSLLGNPRAWGLVGCCTQPLLLGCSWDARDEIEGRPRLFRLFSPAACNVEIIDSSSFLQDRGARYQVMWCLCRQQQPPSAPRSRGAPSLRLRSHLMKTPAGPKKVRSKPKH